MVLTSTGFPMPACMPAMPPAMPPGGGPIIPGKVWPFVCITVACGAISGWHALISSGTTPKMLMKEREALFVGYGAMLMEGFVAVMALIAATVLLPNDYLAINVDPHRWAALGIQGVGYRDGYDPIKERRVPPRHQHHEEHPARPELAASNPHGFSSRLSRWIGIMTTTTKIMSKTAKADARPTARWVNARM